MKNLEQKFCPLIKGPCRSDCAWWREGDEDCAVSIIGLVAVADYNEYMEEKELQDNLYKAEKKQLSN